MLNNGKSSKTPIALVHWGTLNEQSTVVGTLGTIENKVKESKISNPSMIIIGEVVKLHQKLNWFDEEIIPYLPAMQN